MARAGWGHRFKARARELGLTDVAVARALDLPERRFNAYVNEDREPDLATFERMCRALGTTPDAMLGFGEPAGLADVEADVARMEVLIRGLGKADRVRALALMEVLAAHPTVEGFTVLPRGPRRPNALRTEPAPVPDGTDATEVPPDSDDGVRRPARTARGRRPASG